jgi:hypothetical protein
MLCHCSVRVHNSCVSRVCALMSGHCLRCSTRCPSGVRFVLYTAPCVVSTRCIQCKGSGLQLWKTPPCARLYQASSGVCPLLVARKTPQVCVQGVQPRITVPLRWQVWFRHELLSLWETLYFQVWIAQECAPGKRSGCVSVLGGATVLRCTHVSPVCGVCCQATVSGKCCTKGQVQCVCGLAHMAQCKVHNVCVL